MSIRLMSRVWDLDGMPSHLKLVLLRLADHANDDGRCHPGQDRIADAVSQSERTVRLNLDILKRLGLVEVTARRRRAPQEYQLWIPDTAGIDWAAVYERVKSDDTVTFPAGWFLDRQPAAGLTGDAEKDGEQHLDRSPTAGLTGETSTSRPATDRVQDRQPIAAKTGNRLPVSKRNHQRTISEPSEEDLPTVDPPRAKTKSRNPIWDTLAERFYPTGVTSRSTEKRLGRVVATLTAAGATPDTIRDRADAWPRLWPKSTPTLTLEALEKWWDELGVITTQTRAPIDCAECGNRGFLSVLATGEQVPIDHPDAWTSEATVRCVCVEGAA